METHIVPVADTGTVDDLDTDDATECSQDSTNHLEESPAVPVSQEIQERVKVDTPQCSQGASPSFQTLVSSQRNRKGLEGEDYYSRMLLNVLLGKEI